MLNTESAYVRSGVKIMLGLVLKVHSPSYKQQHSETQEQATEIHINSILRTRTPNPTIYSYRHQLRLTGYFHGHTRIILDH
jgi:deoxyribodipyrimidine photolyase